MISFDEESVKISAFRVRCLTVTVSRLDYLRFDFAQRA